MCVVETSIGGWGYAGDFAEPREVHGVDDICGIVTTGLLQDVVARTHALGSQIRCRGLLVHAETNEARAFYEHHVPEFEVLPTDSLHLFLLMKDIRRTLS